MKPSLHPIVCFDHGVVTTTWQLIQVLSFILLHSILLVKYFHVFQLEIINSLPGLEKFLVLADVVLHSLLLEVRLGLPANVHVNAESASILSF